MSQYKAGALSAFLAGNSDPDQSSFDSSSVSTKKPKKKVSVKEPRPEEDVSNEDPTNTEGISAPDAEPKRKRNQSYGKRMSDDEKKRTVFVGNLPADITKKVLKRLFSSCGTIETLRLRSAVPSKPHLPKKAAVIMREFTEGFDKLNAYIKFEESESAKKALKLNGTVIDGRHIQVDSCASGKRYDDKRTVFLGNLPFDTNEEKLYEHFSDCGDIEKVRLVRDRSTGQGKGFGFVVFKDSTSVSFALRLNGEKFQNRELRITRVVKKHMVQNSASVGPKKRKIKDARKSYAADQKSAPKKPKSSKKIRDIVKKKRNKQNRKSYMSTF